MRNTSPLRVARQLRQWQRERRQQGLRPSRACVVAGMARTEHLPIYRAAFDLAVSVEKVIKNFSRYHKYTMGTELRDGSRRILTRTIART